jgi:hypothetical protein
MLQVSHIREINAPVEVEVDPYVPLAVRTFTAPIGAVFYRVGNFETSLVEMPIDPMTGVVRGIKVVSIDRVGQCINDVALPTSHGLPVVPVECIPAKRHDDRQDVSVSLVGNRFFIDWSNGRQIEMRVSHGRLTFFIGNGQLLGAAIESVSESESQQLRQHLPSAYF